MLGSGLLLQPLQHLVNTDPGCIVLYIRKHNLTATRLFESAKNIAANLSAHGFNQHDVAVIAAAPGEQFLMLMYAVLMVSGKIAIIDPEMGRQNYAAKMKQLQPKWIFIDSRLLFLQEHPLVKQLLLRVTKSIPDVCLIKGAKLVAVGTPLPIIRKHLGFQKLLRRPKNPHALIPGDGHVESIIIYTSGTLDAPKGVLHTEQNLNASINALAGLFTQNKKAIVGTYLPHFMLLGIAAGLGVKMMKNGLTAKDKIDFINRESIGILFGPPSDYLPMIKLCEYNHALLPPVLQHVMIGSAPVHIPFLKRLIAVLPAQTMITCTYGMTENLLVSTIDGRQKVNYKGDGDVVGKPVEGVEVRIATDGEICIKSPQMFSRYFHLSAGSEWHQTGDLGKIDDQGNIVLCGRKKEMIIRRNMNIYPALYENTIRHIAGIDEAAFVGIYDESLHDEKVYLAVEGQATDVGLIKKQLEQGECSIDKEALPDVIFSMTIPRKGRQNKIDRQAIVAYIKKNRI